jgi:hypothetical protein
VGIGAFGGDGWGLQSRSRPNIWIPVYGPLTEVAGEAPSTLTSLGLGLLLGASEAAGLTLVGIGLIGHDVPAPRVYGKWDVTPMKTRDTSGLALRATF